MDDWEAKWKEDCRKNALKAAKLWKEKYSKMEPIEKFKGERYRNATFLDSVVEKEDVVETRHTIITWTKNPETKETEMSIWSGVSKSQRFLCVNGPLAGQKIEDKNDDYVLYNRNSGRHSSDNPKCVLVHKGAFK